MVEHAAKAGGNLSKDPFLLSSEKKLSYGLMSSAGLIPTAPPFAGDYGYEKNLRLPFGQRRSFNFKSL